MWTSKTHGSTDLVTEAFLAGAQSAEILSGLGSPVCGPRKGMSRAKTTENECCTVLHAASQELARNDLVRQLTRRHGAPW